MISLNLCRCSFSTFNSVAFSFLLSLSLIPTNGYSSQSLRDPEIAVVMKKINGIVASIDASRKACAQLSPTESSQINVLSFVWELRNRDVTHAVEVYRGRNESNLNSEYESILKRDQSDFDKLNDAMKIEHCEKFLKQILDEAFDFVNQYPQAYTVLLNFNSSLLNTPDSQYREDSFVGCMKGSARKVKKYGSVFDIDVAKVQCKCLTAVHIENTTLEERSLEQTAARNGKSIFDLEHIKRIAPVLARCATQTIP